MMLLTPDDLLALDYFTTPENQLAPPMTLEAEDYGFENFVFLQPPEEDDYPEEDLLAQQILTQKKYDEAYLAEMNRKLAEQDN